MQIVLKLGMLTIEEIETELMNNFQLNKIAARWLAKAVAQLSFSQ